jgi:two-component system response regulator GlrR
VRENELAHLGLIGEADCFCEMLETIAGFAACDVPVLIQGETGTGKEIAARGLHYLGARRDRPFVPVNCGALPDALVENELFGHSRGAYTDAGVGQKGLVAMAEGGTLLLDEVDALSQRAQVTLLRFLQDRQYRPLGAEAPVKADVRVIAATNADLGSLTATGAFRQDLLFRLDVAAIRVPPLRERGDDILLLANHFLSRFGKQYRRKPPNLNEGHRRTLLHYDWPGNVRELENTMHRATILAKDGRLPEKQLGIPKNARGHDLLASPKTSLAAEFAGGLKLARARELKRFERRYLEWVLGQTGGNVSAAARIAGTERRHLGRIILRSGLSPATFRHPDTSARE